MPGFSPPWTPEDDQKLAELLRQNVGMQEAAKRLGRTFYAAKNRASRIGAPARPRPQIWSKPKPAPRATVTSADGCTTVTSDTEMEARRFLKVLEGNRGAHAAWAKALVGKMKRLGILA